MRIEKTEALVLRRTDFSETSQILDLFTRDRGRVAVMARGTRKYGKRAEHLVDLLYHGRAIILQKPSREVQVLTDFEVLHDFPGLRRHLDRYHTGLHVLHLLRRVTQRESPEPRLFGLGIRALDRFQTAPLARLAGEVIAFDYRFLALIGLQIPLARCPACGHGHPDDADTRFDPRAGGGLCRACAAAGDSAGTPFPARARRLIRDLARLTADEREGIELEPGALRGARKILDLALTSGLEAKLPMLRYLVPPP